MMHAIVPIYRDENSIAFAECDKRLIRVMNLMGVKTQIIGNPINYLGTERIPISISYEGLKGFYEANQYMVS